jgi:hypothetical protein
MLHDEFAKDCRVLDSMGWWHTHPGRLGLFYSSVDRDNQATWTDVHSIGIVLNPELNGDGLKVFRGPQSKELECVSDPSILDALRAEVRRGRTAAKPKALPPPVRITHRADRFWRRAIHPLGLRRGELVAITIAIAAFMMAIAAVRIAPEPPQITVMPPPAHVVINAAPEGDRASGAAVPDETHTEPVEPAKVPPAVCPSDSQFEPPRERDHAEEENASPLTLGGKPAVPARPPVFDQRPLTALSLVEPR